LRDMSKNYEIVVYTASLSKVRIGCSWNDSLFYYWYLIALISMLIRFLIDWILIESSDIDFSVNIAYNTKAIMWRICLFLIGKFPKLSSSTTHQCHIFFILEMQSDALVSLMTCVIESFTRLGDFLLLFEIRRMYAVNFILGLLVIRLERTHGLFVIRHRL
jgi:hypothetical protein